MTELAVRPPEDRDFEAWSGLFRGYMAFYQVPESGTTVATVWSWIHDPLHVMQGLVAVDGQDRPVGLAHFHAMPRSLGGNTVCYLSDLFADPTRRGQGIGRRLIDAVLERCRQEGWANLRWLTQDFNYDARKLYDRYARKSDFILYALPVE